MKLSRKSPVIYLLAFCLLIFCSCEKNKLAELVYSGENKAVSIKINDDNVKFPLQFASDKQASESAISFETVEGKQFILGKPSKEKNIENRFTATWKVDKRAVTISIEKANGGYHFSFIAKPDEDITGWGMNLAATGDEYFTGLFERVVDGNQTESWKKGITRAMNLHGQSVDMLIKPTVSLYTPFYLSSNGYGLFVEGTWPGHYDFCKTDPERVLITFEGKSLSGIIYTSTQPAEIVKAHSLYVGPTIVPPEWAFLPWRWRDNHSNLKTYFDGTPVTAPYNSMVVEDILMMKAFDIPCGVYWVDRPWAKGLHGYADFDWDPVRFPNAEKMIGWLHENNTKFLLWVAPWVTGDMRFEAKEKGYAVPIKGPHGDYNESNVAEIDFTNPEACRWLQEKGIEKMLKQGVDGFKLDRSEELCPEDYKVKFNDGRVAREVRNNYPVLYVKTFNESCKKIKGDDFVLIPRAGYTGSSKYSGFWGGDIASAPEGLRAAVIALQRNAIIGFPVWGSDIGGYWGGKLDREITARWLAFGCFCPIMEFGPTEDHAPWSMNSEPGYDTELIAIWRMYAKIHASLAGYTHQLVKEANKTGMPVVRPLFLQYPNQPEAWKDWQTYLYGPDILVSAIWEKGTTKHSCYLPAGEKWIDAWDTSKVYEGGITITVETPMEKIPIFIRKGSSINLGDLTSLYVESTVIAGNVPNLKELQKMVK
jgi:alpha-glucosidase (family GH31 glycosyl hydrolase)